MNNLVAKHSGKYNKAKTFVCRKTASKKGYTKHKNKY